MELVDIADLKSAGVSRAGSSPAFRTKYIMMILISRWLALAFSVGAWALLVALFL
jgi:hypothetical protein